MAFDFITEIFSVASVKTTTPALPFASAMASAAATWATTVGSVEILVKSGMPSIGPGFTLECHPSTLMPAAAALMMLTFCSVASSLSAMITSGFRAIAWPKAAARLAMTPAPSSTVRRHPITLAASVTPSLTPSAPPLR